MIHSYDTKGTDLISVQVTDKLFDFEILKKRKMKVYCVKYNDTYSICISMEYKNKHFSKWFDFTKKQFISFCKRYNWFNQLSFKNIGIKINFLIGDVSPSFVKLYEKHGGKKNA